MKKVIAILFLAIIFLLASCSKNQFVYGDTLQAACQQKWKGCKVLNKNEQIGILLFTDDEFYSSVLNTKFYKNKKGYYFEKDRTTPGAIYKGNDASISHSNFIDDKDVQGEYIFGYVKDKTVNQVQIKYYSQVKGQGFTKHVRIVPVVNQTFLYYVNNHATNSFDEILLVK